MEGSQALLIAKTAYLVWNLQSSSSFITELLSYSIIALLHPKLERKGAYIDTFAIQNIHPGHCKQTQKQ